VKYSIGILSLMHNHHNHFQIPKEIEFILNQINDSGHKAYIVGGALRDFVMGEKDCSDFDIATDATPDDVMKLFPHVVPTGIKHGTVTVLTGKFKVEVTTFRTEKGYSDNRHPDSISFVGTIEEDLSRRDFTMNAMAYDHTSGTILDPYDGQKDIERKIIRCVGNPDARFAEDGLRSMRAVRFAAQLGFSLEPATQTAISNSLDAFSSVSKERVRDEFEKLLLGKWALVGLELLERTGLLGVIIPEMLPCRGCIQKGAHVYDVMDHCFHTVAAAPFLIDIRWAALLHDIGKPATKALGADGIPTFHNHEKVSSMLASKILERLRLPNNDINLIVHLIDAHMFHYTNDWSDAAVRRFIARVGVENLEPLFALRAADSEAIVGHKVQSDNLESLRNRIELVLQKEHAFGLKDLAINGNDVIELGVPKGPIVGKLLSELLETVLDDPAQNNRESLLRICQGLMPKYGIIKHKSQNEL